MDPEQTAPMSDLDLHCLYHRGLHFSRRDKQTTFVAFGALRVRICQPNSISLLGNIVFHSFLCTRAINIVCNVETERTDLVAYGISKCTMHQRLSGKSIGIISYTNDL